MHAFAFMCTYICIDICVYVSSCNACVCGIFLGRMYISNHNFFTHTYVYICIYNFVCIIVDIEPICLSIDRYRYLDLLPVC